MEIVPLQAKLPKKLPLLYNLLHLLPPLLIDKSDLDRPFLDKIDLIVIVGFEIDIFPLGHFHHAMFDIQILIFLVREVAP
jgi:hypothetical protein